MPSTLFCHTIYIYMYRKVSKLLNINYVLRTFDLNYIKFNRSIKNVHFYKFQKFGPLAPNLRKIVLMASYEIK